MAEEKLRAGEVFASYKRQGTPRGLQKGVENIFCISCLGLANAREPSGRYSLLAILAAYGETAPWWFGSWQSGVQFVGSESYRPQTERTSGTRASFALCLSKRVSSPNYMKYFPVSRNFNKATLANTSGVGKEEGPHPKPLSERQRLTIRRGQRAERAQLPTKGLLVLSAELARSPSVPWKERGSDFSLGF